MNNMQKIMRSLFLFFFLFFTQTYAGIFEGIYTSKDGVQLNIFKIGDNTYSLSSNHSNNKTEVGHDWKGTGVLVEGKYLGVWKYLDNDSKYKGLSGTHKAVFISETCFDLTGSISSNNHKFGPFRYCKK